MTPETKVKNSIANYIKSLQKEGKKILLERRQALAIGSYKSGSSDTFIVVNGRHIEVEYKGPTGVQSSLQRKWEKKCKDLDIPYLLVDSLEDFKEKFKPFL